MTLNLEIFTLLLGIGRDLTKALVRNGANVIGISRSEGHLNELKAELASSTFRAIQLDLSDWNKTREALQKLDVKLDGIVNNAGTAVIKPFSELTEEDYDWTMNINLKAAFNVVQSLLPKLNDGCSIVNLSSLAGLTAFGGHSVYSMSKAGLDMLTKSLTVELAPRKIRCNSVNPTVILTRMGRENWSDSSKAQPLLDRIPLRRFGEVSEVVKPILFLLSDESSYINGISMPIEGGYQAGSIAK